MVPSAPRSSFNSSTRCAADPLPRVIVKKERFEEEKQSAGSMALQSSKSFFGLTEDVPDVVPSAPSASTTPMVENQQEQTEAELEAELEKGPEMDVDEDEDQGCFQHGLGLESPSDRVLRHMCTYISSVLSCRRNHAMNDLGHCVQRSLLGNCSVVKNALLLLRRVSAHEPNRICARMICLSIVIAACCQLTCFAESCISAAAFGTSISVRLFSRIMLKRSTFQREESNTEKASV